MNCKHYVDCGSPKTLLGYDANQPDAQVWFGLGFAPITPPPLGWTFDRTTAFAIRESSISKAVAESDAQAAAVFDAQRTWVPPGDLPPIEWESPVDDYAGVPPLV